MAAPNAKNAETRLYLDVLIIKTAPLGGLAL
jgi:hypothetical protein